MASSHSYLLVAAIDIGTTYSGYAFSFVHAKDVIKTNKIWKDSEEQRVSYKTPSIVLLNPEREFHSFGFDAESKYALLAASNQHTDWYYFKHFKMRLYKEQYLNRSLMLYDVGGKEMEGMTVFAMAIRYLKTHLLDLVNQSCTPVIEESEIKFVLTVPAIWDESAKQFMRESAEQAGIDAAHVTVALEPEAASIYCRSLEPHVLLGTVRSFVTIPSTATGAVGTVPFESSDDDEQNLPGMNTTNEARNAVDIRSKGACYMILDCGGGTVDITVHQVGAQNRLKELHKPVGSDLGGAKVDEAFSDFLIDLFTPTVITAFKKDHRADWLQMERDFELLKRRIPSPKEERLGIPFPIALNEILEDHALQITGDDDKVNMVGDKLRVKMETLISLLRPTCESIVDIVKDLVQSPECSGVKTIIMVGGFSESPMLQGLIRGSFPDHCVITPEDAALAVVKGAVMFGHEPGAIATRRSPYTYGVETAEDFVPDVHEGTHYKLVDGVGKCMDVFSIFIQVNQEIELDQLSEGQTYHPLYSGQTRASIPVYRSTVPSPMYTTDPACSRVGEVIVPMPDLAGDKKRKVLVNFVFGGPEMTVRAKEVATGKEYQAKFDFLSE